MIVEIGTIVGIFWAGKERVEQQIQMWNSREPLLCCSDKSKPENTPELGSICLVHTFSHQLPTLKQRLAPRSSIYNVAIINWTVVHFSVDKLMLFLRSSDEEEVDDC